MKRKTRAEASQKSKTETEAVYEQIRGDTPPLQEENSKDNATVELEKDRSYDYCYTYCTIR